MSQAAQTSAFAGLIADLGVATADTDTLAKSIAAGADKDAAADAEDPDADKDAPAADAADGKDAAADANIAANAEEAEGKTGLAKSFQITLEDGTVVDAIDGGEMIKSLVERLERNESETVAALTAATAVIKGQGELLKSMNARLDAIGNSGVRRKAVLQISERPSGEAADALVKSTAGEGTITAEQLMTKSLAAQAAGRVSGIDIAVAEQAIQAGQQPSDAFIRAVMAPE